MKKLIEKIKGAFNSDPEFSETAAAILVLLVFTIAIIGILHGASK